MDIPEVIIDHEREYFLVKEYPNFFLYEAENKLRICKSRFDLGLIKNDIIPKKGGGKWL